MAEVNEPKGSRFSWWYLVVAFWAVLLIQQLIGGSVQTNRMSYSEFKTALAEDRVADVTVSQTTVQGHLKPSPAEADTKATNGPRSQRTPPSARNGNTGSAFSAVRVDDPELMRQLSGKGVRVTGAIETTFWRDLLAWLIPIALIVGLWALLSRRAAQSSQNGFLTVGRSKAKIYMEREVKVSFSDVAGAEEAKEELREEIEFLRNPARFGRLGAKIPKGILLVGPPGTGKTLLARAVAGEAGVPFFSISGSDFVEMFVGVGAARVRDLFEQAKQKAPCIIFVDELDALGKVRGVGPVAHEEREQTLNQLLVEMDGFDARVGVILMAATNRPEILDPALLRAGRFDRHVLVDRPDKNDRLAILCVHARKVVLESEADLEVVASMTAGMVGADLANLVNEAALLGIRRDKEKVGLPELLEAVERIIAGLEKKNRLLSPAERERIAHHEVGHALVALALPGSETVQKISIIPRGIAALGYTLHVPTEERFLMTQEELQNKIAVLMAGRVAEEIVYDEVSTGAHDDIGKATDIARSMVKKYGMSPRLGEVNLDSKEGRPLFLQQPDSSAPGDYSEETARAIDAEVRRLIDEQRARALEILTERRGVLMAAARVLMARETISGNELRALMDEGSVQPDVSDSERDTPAINLH